MPFILTGIRQGVALGLIGVVVGEMFGGSQGIGFMVAYGGQTFATDTLFVGVLIIAFAGIILTPPPSSWKSASPAGVPSDKHAE